MSMSEIEKSLLKIVVYKIKFIIFKLKINDSTYTRTLTNDRLILGT